MKKTLPCFGGFLGALAAAFLCVPFASAHAAGQAKEGCHVEEITDQDGDLQLLMESEWISMHIMPSLQSTIARFVFRPTGNDILDAIQPKLVQRGGGMLKDNFWEVDWRFQEFKNRFYDYQITKNTPQEVQAVFETKTIGFLQANDSGIISKLLSNIRIRRTVTLRAGTPYFLFDLELSTSDKNAKLPLMWTHNSVVCDQTMGDQVHRPSARGVRRIGAPGRINSTDTIAGEEPYVYDFNKGWSAQVSASSKEGIVYLMDYDYINFLYNCGTGTAEWIYDNVLILNDRPWKSRCYILPVMGLSKVDYANEYFIVEVAPKRTKGRMDITYNVTASYEPVKRVTFNTEIVSNLLGEKKKAKLDPIEVQGLGVAPVIGTAGFDAPDEDPLLLNVTAFVELADGSIQKKEFQYFHVGEYRLKDNIRIDLVTPVVQLERPVQKPFVPVPKEGMTVNRKDNNYFAVLGNLGTRLKLREAVRAAGKMSEETDIGYTPGWNVSQSGLTDFPYDYTRLFEYRSILFHNTEPETIRRVGASILVNYLTRGGGLVLTGGDSAFTTELSSPVHDINNYIPVKAKGNNLAKTTLQLNSPVADHPIFKGIDLSKLPYAYFVHDLELKPDLPSKVLMKVGDKPFIIELTRGDQRTICVLSAPFGDEGVNAGKPAYWSWDQWEKLMSNIMKYTGHAE